MRLILLLLLYCPIAPVLAQAVDYYSGSVPVADRSQSAREATFPDALEQVLGKLSGRGDFDDHPEVKEAVQSARSMVVSFHYGQIERPSDQPDSANPPANDEESQTLLVAKFSKEGVDQMLRGLGLQRWPTTREPLNIWLLVDDGLSRNVLPLEYEFLRKPLDRIGEIRGMPFRWPRPDAEGNYDVDVQLLWGGYTESLEAQGEHVLIVAARREGPEWNARMTLQYGSGHWSWRSRDIDLERALSAAFHQAVDEIAAAQAISTADQGSWIHEISVSGFASSEDYMRCVSYLESLDIVDEVGVTRAEPGLVRMVLTLNASPEYLDQVLSDDMVLEYVEVSGQYVLQQ